MDDAMDDATTWTMRRHGRCEGSGEKGAHEQVMMRSWMNAWMA